MGLELKSTAELYRVVLSTYNDVYEKHSALSPESFRQGRERLEHWFLRAQTDKKFLNGMKEGVRGVAESLFDLPETDVRHFLRLVKERAGVSFFEIACNMELEVQKIVSRNRLRGSREVRLLIDYVSDHPNGAYVSQATQLLSRDASGK